MNAAGHHLDGLIARRLGTHTLYAGGRVHACPLTGENRFFPDLSSIPLRVRKRAKLFYINYPNNPTGQRADRGFYERILDFAGANDLLVVQDCACGAFNMTGWGNADSRPPLLRGPFTATSPPPGEQIPGRNSPVRPMRRPTW